MDVHRALPLASPWKVWPLVFLLLFNTWGGVMRRLSEIPILQSLSEIS